MNTVPPSKPEYPKMEAEYALGGMGTRTLKEKNRRLLSYKTTAAKSS
jgi:vacuolar-type H+-ATPase subunit D/Vma8